MKQLIIGDIHGCFDELQSLLDKTGLSETDEIICIGDLVDRGPKPRQVCTFFRETPNAKSLRGNHEQKHLRASRGELKPAITQLITRWEMNELYEDALAYFDTLPYYLELPDALLVHGFFEPNVPLFEQNPKTLLGTMSAEYRLRDEYARPWYEYYNEDQPIIVGHRDYSALQKPFVWKDLVYGLDTRCVYGGSLTGILLPEFEFISVPARRDHWTKVKSRYSVEG